MYTSGRKCNFQKKGSDTHDPLYFLVVLFMDIIGNIRFKGCEAPQLQPINVHGWLVERGGSVCEVGHLAFVGDIGQHIGHDHTALVS